MFPVVTNLFPIVTNLFPVITNLFPVVTHLFPVVTNLFPAVTNLFLVVTNLFPVVTNLFPVITNPAVAHLAQHELVQRGQSLGLLLVVLRIRQGLQKTLSRHCQDSLRLCHECPDFVKNVLTFSRIS